MARRSKVVFCLLLAFIYVVVNVCPLRAEALPDVMSGSTTLADNIMTYYALSGSAVANSDWINSLYSAFGSEFGTIESLADQGYLVMNESGMWEPVQQLGQMIEQTPAYSSLGLNEMFNVSAEEVAAGGGLAVASGGSILAGSLGGVASTGVVPLLGATTASYWGGIALGTLASHAIQKYAPWIYGETPIDKNFNLTNGMTTATVNDRSVVMQYGNYANVVHTPDPYWYLYVINPTDVSSINRWSLDGTTYYDMQIGSHNTYNLGYLGNLAPTTQGNVIFDVVQDRLSALNNHLTAAANGGIKKAGFSPDVIGENGNQVGEYDPDEGYSVPDIKPMIDPGTQAGKPLTLQDWQNFANSVSNNNSQTNPTNLNKTLYDNILDLIRTAIPENVPNPNPNPNPDPWSPPVVTPVPDPSYPDPVPDQQITENPQESENPQQTENPIDTGKPWRLPDLRHKFPFCVPWDIAKIFSKLKVNARQAPHISWRFNPPNTPIDYTFNLDLEDFEEAAALLRTLELMGFIVGLAFVTRYLIGAN